MLSTHKAELTHCNVNLLNLFNLTSGGGVSLRGPEDRTPEIDASEITVDWCGTLRWMISGISQRKFTCSVALAEELSLPQWIFTGIVSGILQWILTSASSGVQSFVPRSRAACTRFRVARLVHNCTSKRRRRPYPALPCHAMPCHAVNPCVAL